ncbi:MAG: single-stranded DNA-binding protein [Desulfuromonadales bacterium]|nr:single-stranded DNA-binding protein [Desulfuromonadales bacterium]
MSVNKAILVGNLGKDPELRYTAAGTAVASFTLATTERFKNRNGEQQERTEWHNVVAWGPLAEICGKYLSKGRQIYVEGRIQNRSYDDRDGNKRYISEVVISEMQMLGRPGDDAGGARSGAARPAAAAGAASASAPGDAAAASGSFEEPPFNPDDDIPF